VAEERHGVNRLEAFSDGVFAIAITLLVLGIEIPDVAEDQLWEALRDLGPSVFGYFLGFAVIGLFWVVHHEFFGQVARVDARLLWTNLLFLSLIAAMPFSTGLLGDFDSSEVATVIFAANVGLAAIASHVSAWLAIRGGLLDDGSPAIRERFLTADLLVPVIFLGSIPLVLISPGTAQLSWLLAIVVSALPSGDNGDGPGSGS
jgi:uncharacterized membrane protein